MQINELIAFWDSNDGKPYKGKLIDIEAYRAADDAGQAMGCMCAQGQVLHSIGGMTVEELGAIRQWEADNVTAKLLNISIAHACLLRIVNDREDGAPSIVLTDPAKVIGDQAETVLAFWRYVDGMSAAAWAAAWAAARAAAWAAAEDAAWAAAGAAAQYATAEIMSARIMRERGHPFFFLPLFGFANPEAVFAADKLS